MLLRTTTLLSEWYSITKPVVNWEGKWQKVMIQFLGPKQKNIQKYLDSTSSLVKLTSNPSRPKLPRLRKMVMQNNYLVQTGNQALSRVIKGTGSDIKLFLHVIKVLNEKILGKFIISYFHGRQLSIFTNS